MDDAGEWARAVLLDGASVGQARDLLMAVEDGELSREHMRLAELEYLAELVARGHSIVGDHVRDAIWRGHSRRSAAVGMCCGRSVIDRALSCDSPTPHDGSAARTHHSVERIGSRYIGA